MQVYCSADSTAVRRFGADQFCRGDAFAALLSALPIWPQVFPPLHRLDECVFANVCHVLRLNEYSCLPQIHRLTQMDQETTNEAFFLHFCFPN